ncbi:MAG: type III PLP-dependent enzyme [Pseudomonadales bacterium]
MTVEATKHFRQECSTTQPHQHLPRLNEFVGKVMSSTRQQNYAGPLLFFDKSRLLDNYRHFRTVLPHIDIHYAVKCLPDKDVLKTLFKAGSRFEIASKGELALLLSMGVNPQQILYSNPIKSPAYIHYAAQQGVEWYAIDSLDELHKIAAIKADAKLYLRIHTSNKGSLWPLEGKFGAHQNDIEEILITASTRNINLLGVTFHVGSQCLNPDNWRKGIISAKHVFVQMEKLGLKPQLLNIGGGFPVNISKNSPSIEEIANIINQEIKNLSPDISVVAEPGRYLVASAGCLVCRVVGTATRSGQRWLYLDSGVYTGLMEMAKGFPYPIVSERKGLFSDWNIAGPTCDSIDVCRKKAQLPSDLHSDDFIYILSAGAYTVCCASNFNGFKKPKLVFLDNIPKAIEI